MSVLSEVDEGSSVGFDRANTKFTENFRQNRPEFLYSKDWDKQRESPRGTRGNEGVHDSFDVDTARSTEDKRQIRGLRADYDDGVTGQDKAVVPVAVQGNSEVTFEDIVDFEEDEKRKVEGYSSEEEDLDGKKHKVVQVEKNSNASGQSPKKVQIKQPEVKQKGETNKLYEAPIAEKEWQYPVKAKDVRDSAKVTRSSSPPHMPSTKLKPVDLEEDRENDYSSSSATSSGSEIDSESEVNTPRPVDRKSPEGSVQDSAVISKAPKTPETRNEGNLPSYRSYTSESTDPSSVTSESDTRRTTDTESKATSLPERPKSPVAQTFLREEELEEKAAERAKADSPIVPVNQSVVQAQVETHPDQKVEAVPPADSARSELESATRGKDFETSSSESNSDESSSETDNAVTPRPQQDESKFSQPTPLEKEKALSYESSSLPESEKKSPLPKSEDAKRSPKVSESETSSLSSDMSDRRVSLSRAARPKSSVGPLRMIESDDSELSQEEDEPEQMKAGVWEPEIKDPKTLEKDEQVATRPASDSQGHGSETVDGQQAAPPEGSVSPVPKGSDFEASAPKEHDSGAPQPEQGSELEEKKGEKDGLATKPKDKSGASDSSSVDSSSDSNESESSSDLSSESEGELIVQPDTPNSADKEGETTPAATADPTPNGVSAATRLTNGLDGVHATEQNKQKEQADIENGFRKLPSPPTTPPRSPVMGQRDMPVIPSVVVIPNTPDGRESDESRDGAPLIKQIQKGVPPSFDYKSPSDDEGHSRLASESEPENMHGGNDPDNVAENDSSNWRGSMQFKQPPPQLTHQGNLAPLLDGTDGIELHNLALSDSQMAELMHTIATRETLHTISISNSGLGMEEMPMLLQSLAKSAAKPAVLNLNNNILGPRSVLPLVEILKIKPSIEMLLLQGNPIGNDGLRTLVDGLLDIEFEAQEFKKRETEKMQGVPLSVPRGCYCQLLELDIGEASVTDEGMVDVALLLESNLDLKTLSLSSSPDISYSGWSKLSAALAKNHNLKTLTLEHNKIGDGGMQVLCDGLKSNSSVTTLDLADAGIGETGGRALIDLLKRNTTILHLTLTPGNNIPQSIMDEIKKYLLLNEASAS